MLARHTLLLPAFAAIVLLGGCEGSPNGPPCQVLEECPEEIPPIVTLTPSSASIEQGDILQLRATVTDVDGNLLFPSYTNWWSSNPDVARLVRPGTVEGGKLGTALIVASYEHVADTAKITVHVPDPCPDPWSLSQPKAPCPRP
jgi:hypothetical protein